MFIRKSDLFLIMTGINVALVIALSCHAAFSRAAATRALKQKGELVRELRLTDLCLFTEATYSRHLSLADLHAPFQDNPGAFEHFPSGSLVGPPVRSSEIP